MTFRATGLPAEHSEGSFRASLASGQKTVGSAVKSKFGSSIGVEILKPQRTQRNTKVLGGKQGIIPGSIFTRMVKGKNEISTVYFAIFPVSAYLCVLCGS